MYQPDIHGMFAQILKDQGYRSNPEQIFNAKENYHEWNERIPEFPKNFEVNFMIQEKAGTQQSR